MEFKKFLKKNIVLMDGATGTMLIRRGLKIGEYPERMNITNPDVLTEIHKEYFDAGSNVVCTNTFGANSLKFNDDELEEIVKASIQNVKKARELSNGKQEKFVALDIGPTGRMLKPFGDLEFEGAVNIFKKTVLLGVKYGVDLVLIETMNDVYEAKAGVLAVKECSNLPVIVSNVYGADGLTLTGSTPESAVATFEGLGVDAIGTNCSLGPEQLFGVIDKMINVSSIPVIFKPNAGLPKVVDGKTVYDISAEDFSDAVIKKVKSGVRIIGGCCGTSPEFISLLNKKLKGVKPVEIFDKNLTVVSSYAKEVSFDKPVIIGERINPTGKKRLKQAIIENDLGYILEEGVNEQKAGAHVLDVNVGVPEIEEGNVLPKVVKEIQAVVDLPLCIDTVSVNALENTLRIYNGKALINSVNGKQESMDQVFPVAKKYGGVVICLTLDENGIPETAEGRFAIAEKIVLNAKNYGIKPCDLIFDALTLSVASDGCSALTTLKTVKMLNERGYKTVLGVSNVSFGLPEREVLNASFYNSALSFGLTSAIINPFSKEMLKTYYGFCALKGYDPEFKNYISFSDGTTEKKEEIIKENLTLCDCIKKGFKEQAKNITENLIKEKSAVEIINEFIIPALDEVGKDYENKKAYLPQLLISAETAKVSFEVLKSHTTSNSGKKCKIVLATVKGDIHDIGKNIVKMMLSNYGFTVYDLGKDVEPELIINEIEKTKADICGLSALMTTTVKYMKETVELIKNRTPWCKTVVGGAVLTQEYADQIGADKYAKDAMETVRFAESVEKGIR